MIAVGIFGGLASQMNQYAFLRVLQRHFPNAVVKMALADGWRRYMEHNGYELDRVFGIERDSIDWNTLRQLADFYPGSGLKAKFFNAMFQIRDRLFGPKGTQITLPPLKAPDWSVFNLDERRDVLFWSNYPMGYFDEVAGELRQTFTFKPELDDLNKERLSLITSVNSVSIHVRRGDYIKYKYPLLGIDYYRSAVEKIRARVSNPRFFVFSNDPQWCEMNLGFLEGGGDGNCDGQSGRKELCRPAADVRLQA